MRLSFYSGLLFAVLLAEDEWAAANAIRMTTDDISDVQDFAQTDAMAEAETDSEFFH